MRMKCEFLEKEVLSRLMKPVRPKDVVLMKTIWDTNKSRYLVIQVKKSLNYIEVLPLEQFFKNPEKIEAPVLSVPFYMIEDIKKIDNGNLLFLANQPNPHILGALEAL